MMEEKRLQGDALLNNLAEFIDVTVTNQIRKMVQYEIEKQMALFYPEMSKKISKEVMGQIVDAFNRG